MRFLNEFALLWKENLLPFLNRILVTNDLLHVTAGSLIKAFIFFLLAWQGIRILVPRLESWIFRKRIHDDETLAWLRKFNQFVLVILASVITLLIAGLKNNALKIIWNLTLFTLGDSKVDLGNIIIGLVLLYPGIRLSRTITAEFRSIILSRMKMDDTAKNLIDTLFYYLLIILMTLFVMTIIGIPLTAFTVIGGALAIGFGLGSQNLVNNFLSGLILLIEHPMKVGDVVDVAGHIGNVEEIGARATRIKTFDNLRVIIPNSKILEDNFTNWSLIDSFLRREINVGVAYGTDMDLAMDICGRIVKAHSEVEKDPSPIILFSDFGDNALNIRILFWTRMKKNVNILSIESELRRSIYRDFSEHEINIAFPQRDVHLDASSPIHIKLEK